MPEITKRCVTMRRYVAHPPAKPGGKIRNEMFEAVDYVRPDFLDAYVADARTKWDEVLVSDDPDAGPGGYHGQTHVPEHLAHPLAGQTFAATEPERKGGGGAGKVSRFLPTSLLMSVFLGLVLTGVMLLVRGLWTIQTSAMRNALENTYGTTAAYGAAYTTAPGGSAGTEPSGGSPAYARKALTWSGNAPKTTSATFDIPSGTTIVGGGVHSAVTAGTYYDGASVTSQTFASQGTYLITFNYTQS